MENKKIKNVKEVDLAISEFTEKMINSGYGVELSRCETKDTLFFELRLTIGKYSTITCINCSDSGELHLTLGGGMWTPDELSDITFAVTSSAYFIHELKKLFKYDED